MMLRLMGCGLVAVFVSMMGASALAKPVGGPPSESSNDAPFVRAEIHIVQWNLRTAIAMSIDAVRASTSAVISLGSENEIAGLVSLLDVDRFGAPAKKAPLDGDFRLVVDLVRGDGTKESFVADNARLYRLRDGASRPIDRAFKQRFTFIRVP